MHALFEEPCLHRKIVPAKLVEYGFTKKGDAWQWETLILDGAFTLCIEIADGGVKNTSVVEVSTGEPYILYKTNAQGSFVGSVRSAILERLCDIAQKCTEQSVFRCEQTLRTIEYVRNTYGVEPEFLWKKFPDNAVWRRADTNKWFGAILTVKKNRLGFDSEEKIEIVDLRAFPEQLERLLKTKNYYPGYHMNKKSWYTVILDGSLSDEELFLRIDESFCAEKEKKARARRG